MKEAETIFVNDNLQIPLSEVQFRYARSSGPGGQHVNRSESQVTLLWDVRHSTCLSQTQRHRIEKALAGRIDKAGVLHLTSGARRSQLQNKQAVIERLILLLRAAVRRRKRRIPTRPGAAAREKRLQRKQRHAAKKRLRRKPETE